MSKTKLQPVELCVLRDCYGNEIWGKLELIGSNCFFLIDPDDGEPIVGIVGVDPHAHNGGVAAFSEWHTNFDGEPYVIYHVGLPFEDDLHQAQLRTSDQGHWSGAMLLLKRRDEYHNKIVQKWREAGFK